MATHLLHIDLMLPNAVSPRFKSEVARESRTQTVLALFKRGACSAGVAAKMLRLSLHEFLVLLKEHGVPYSPGSRAATAADRRTLAVLRQQRSRRHSSSP